ncbi:PaaX family transcriptional regulator [Arthrobacter yangruifuii]|uniref:PaaX family transcriptional regulator n=1 Tax=Arthrobacter yangruifuii TaxID=2606616 RepID=A0A5N6MQW7_9MICC|nr:PaaX family transcriptional regulator C-terminal domain-containing protein [Arthrobacter yangruifuii]KAD3720540.1 PaaX family transcriptional regulator [Arthrobacter yangruifuii]
MSTSATASVPILPRFQNGARSQQLLTVLLGDYWHARKEPIPSAALVELLQVFGITATGGRAAIQRLAQRGFLIGTKAGRLTAYAVSPMSRERINYHVRALFMGHISQPWDGTWTLVGYSLPEDARGTRRLLRDQLRQLHFGNLYDALWIRPGNQLESVVELQANLGAQLNQDHLTVFTDARLPEGTGLDAIHAAFGLPELAADYAAFINRWEPFARKLEQGPEAVLGLSPGSSERSGDEALRLRTSLMADWRTLRRQDPRLPHELLGAGFPLYRAVAACAALYDSLGPAAEAGVRRILRVHDEQLAERITHHTFAASASLLSED